MTLGCVPPPRSAGVGRTGTFIVIDAMIDMMHAEQKVDVFGFVARIREQRSQLIQTDVSLRAAAVGLWSLLLPFQRRFETTGCFGSG